MRKIILAENLLRRPFTADGPISLEGMFEVGYPNRASMSRSRRSVGGGRAVDAVNAVIFPFYSTRVRLTLRYGEN